MNDDTKCSFCGETTEGTRWIFDGYSKGRPIHKACVWERKQRAAMDERDAEIRAAREEGRRAGLEEAARYLEGIRCDPPSAAVLYTLMANGIRALADKEAKKP